MPHAEALGPLYSQQSPAGLIRLQTHLLAKFPGSHAGGMYNPASSLSGGGPSPHRVTQAVDVMCPQDVGMRIIRYLIDIAEPLNLQQVIAWHEIITVQRWSSGIRNYAAYDHSGGNGHAHIHVGLAASRYFDVSWIGGGGTPQPTPPPPPPPPPTVTNEENNVYIEFNNQTHVFFKNTKTGQVGHAWPGGFENLNTQYGFEGMDPDSSSIEVHLSPAPGIPVIHVGGMARAGTKFLEYKFWGKWVAEIFPKD